MALKSFARNLRIYAPRIEPAQLIAHFSGMARVESTPPLLANVLANSRLVIHHGGSGVAAEAMAAGVPQLLLSTHVEQELNGNTLARAGVGKHFRLVPTETKIDPALIESVASDSNISARAERLASQCRRFVASADALGNCERVCLKLL